MLRSAAVRANSARNRLGLIFTGLLAAGAFVWSASNIGGVANDAARRLTRAESSPATRSRSSLTVRASTQLSTAAHRVPSARGRPVQVPDPLAAQSAPAPASVHHGAAVSPASAGAIVAAGAPSDAEVRQELRVMRAVESAARTSPRIAASGTVMPRAGIPQSVAQVILGANAITDFPYVFGGGHASFVDNAYDCSGSVSYALAAAGLLSAPETSGEFESWGAPGPGRWITVYANPGHMYMIVDGLRYDTAGRTGVFSTRWQTGPDPGAGPNNTGMVARHYPSL